MAFKPQKKRGDDVDTIEIINAIRFCIGKDPIPETGKNRSSGDSDECDDLYTPDFDVLKALGLVK